MRPLKTIMKEAIADYFQVRMFSRVHKLAVWLLAKAMMVCGRTWYGLKNRTR